MKNFKISYSQKAKNDLKEIVLYVDNNYNSYVVANNIFNSIKDKINNIASNPFIYPSISNKARIKNVRKAIVKKYLIFYIIDEANKKIVIVRIIDGRRNWKRLI